MFPGYYEIAVVHICAVFNQEAIFEGGTNDWSKKNMSKTQTIYFTFSNQA